jgi:transposase
MSYTSGSHTVFHHPVSHRLDHEVSLQGAGSKERLGRISKKGNTYIRRLLAGATSMLRYARAKTATGAAWVNGLLQRLPARLVTVAMANKTARISWAVMVKGENFRASVPPVIEAA